MGDGAPQAGMRILLLFTYRISLQVWLRQGLLPRELAYYRALVRHGLAGGWFMTYGPGDGRHEALVRPFDVLPRRWRGHDAAYSWAAAWLHRWAFRAADVIKSNQANGAWAGVLAKLLWPRKVFVVRCGYVSTEALLRTEDRLSRVGIAKRRLQEWAAFRMCDLAIVTTETDRDFLRRTYGIPASRIEVIPNAIDIELFRPPERPREWRAPFRLVAVGRFSALKNFGALISAVKGLAPCGALQIIGGGAEQARWMELARREGVAVEFLPFMPNDAVAERLRAADILVLPQLAGAGMSKTMLEAMSCGLVTVSSDIQAHRDVITPGVNGFLCSPDVEALRACLRSVMELPPEQLARVSARARQDVEARYSMDANARREMNLLHGLVSRARVGGGVRGVKGSSL